MYNRIDPYQLMILVYTGLRSKHARIYLIDKHDRKGKKDYTHTHTHTYIFSYSESIKENECEAKQSKKK